MRRSATNRLRSLPDKKASFVEPMECLSVARLPEGSQWLWEIKLDAVSSPCGQSGSDVTLFSRRRKSLNRRFPYIVERLADLPDGTVVDGELVAIAISAGLICQMVKWLVLPRIHPMRLRLVKEPFDNSDYIFELKHDGFRAVVYLQNGECKIVSRNQRNLGFDSLKQALAKLPLQSAIG